MKLRHGSRLKGFESGALFTEHVFRTTPLTLEKTPFLNIKIHLFYIEKSTSAYLLHLLIL